MVVALPQPLPEAVTEAQSVAVPDTVTLALRVAPPDAVGDAVLHTVAVVLGV